MRKKLGETKNGFCNFPARAFSALGVCALLVVNGMPPVALTAPSPAPVPVSSGLSASVHSVRLLAPAKLSRARMFLSPSALPPDDGGDIQANDAVRFLEEATFGPSFATDPADPNFPVSVAHVQAIGFQAWLTEQFTARVLIPDDPLVPNVGTNYAYPGDPGQCDDPGAGGAGGGICWSPANRSGTCTNITNVSTCARDNYTVYLLQSQFYFNALTGPDQLRQRVAWALSQVDVVSEVDIGLSGWMTPYVQVFDRDAFGNFRQLLYDITVNPAMGEYLNMRGNVKTNVNENYAREILQLFSVGLNLLNQDGTVQVDGNGNAIPTYSQEAITNFARVFTGWNFDAQIAPGILNYRDPMIVTNENNHDQNPKTLLDYPNAVNRDLPGGEDALTELNEALNNIFNHPNVGPFIGKLLIQKLVTSNPSPGYVSRVAAAFNDDGTGTRGNMQAVISAVLLDPEARTDPSGNASYGHLREPVLFITNTLRALGITASDGSFTTDFVLGDSFLPSGAGTNVRMDQDVFRPPTVFSYYPPDNQLAGSILLAPEFAIQSTSTSLAHINIVYDIAYHKMPTDAVNRPLGTWVDTTPYEPEAGGDATALINDLNNRLMHGSLTAALQGIVLNAVTAIPDTDLTGRVQEAIYLIASSSQYQVER